MAIGYGVQDWVEGGVITAVIALNVGIGFLQVRLYTASVRQTLISGGSHRNIKPKEPWTACVPWLAQLGSSPAQERQAKYQPNISYQETLYISRWEMSSQQIYGSFSALDALFCPLISCFLLSIQCVKSRSRRSPSHWGGNARCKDHRTS